ncbi:Pro-Pol poly [Paramuricea clavata]|uniref:Pro-Pol poly n=1 Tax=Paramuricea clavata TaxID=317549 RepID=A0A7D9ES20_PARCT|nr:Pro-Pol poly [Paramuricea clavata]
MKSGNNLEDLQKFKREVSDILKNAKFPIHKWESNLPELESEDVADLSRILGHIWQKAQDTLEVNVESLPDDQLVTKRKMLRRGGIYDPLGLTSPTVVEGKRLYREACQSTEEWNIEVPKPLRKEWLKWNRQFQTVRVPRSISTSVRKMKAVHLHVFSDVSNMACQPLPSLYVVEGITGVVKGLLASKSRISKQNTTIPRLELVSGHMAANMVKNLWRALKHWPIVSTTVWMGVCTRAGHLEMTKSQTADEFQRKLNTFITRRTRPELIISDNAKVFKATASWIKEIRKTRHKQDKSPWWGGMYERLLKDVKKTLYKTLGKTNIAFEQLEAVIVGIERHLNNRPLIYVGSDEEQVLTSNMIWGQNCYILENDDTQEDLDKMLEQTLVHGKTTRMGTVGENESAKTNPDDGKKTRNRKSAAEDARKKIKQLAEDEKI